MTTKEELRNYLDAHPEIAEGSRKGFEDIREGHYRTVAPKTGADAAQHRYFPKKLAEAGRCDDCDGSIRPFVRFYRVFRGEQYAAVVCKKCAKNDPLATQVVNGVTVRGVR